MHFIHLNLNVIEAVMKYYIIQNMSSFTYVCKERLIGIFRQHSSNRSTMFLLSY